MPQFHTAILLFSRSASAEAENKSFGGGKADKRITEALISRTEETIARTGLRVYRSDEASQRGETFGERLALAMKEVFEKGAERLLVVGNDCPQISTSHLRSAALKLAAGENVIGPDRRGGVWLIGLQRSDFDAELFAGIGWQTENLLNELVQILPRHSEAIRLGDLNCFEDLSQHWFLLRKQLSELFDLMLLADAAFGVVPETVEPVTVMRRLGRAPPI
ncbi:DUF2064 domain-containing protein [Neolewinella aurantiaca]|uniref:DUF2064 domain-containing protein n=1 Tax=Neolewinella aurantiaca TaxID=2602767 RepID=A0A5C7FUF1_9BACT|nr:DUF2064 domain-containing protein [Neolewinella aurantiaca]TXF91804.1 DUF2064 domain-containing protein [Neolewinella aurantiaca]